jgi:uncharacterized protein YxeA
MPTGLAAVPATTTVDLSWLAASGTVTGYRVYRAGVLRGDLPAGTLIFTDTASAATGYSYTVRAVNASGESVDSAVVNTLTRALPPAITGSTSTASTATLTWTPSTGTVTGYRVYRDSAFIMEIANAAATGYTDGGLQPATTYTYTVRAYNASGLSQSFTTATVTTMLAAPADLVVGVGVPGTGKATVAWASVTTGVVDGYNIYRNGMLARSATLAELTPDPLDPINRVLIEDAGLLSEMIYAYTVRAFNTNGESADSIAVVVHTPNWGNIVTPPAAPTNLLSDNLALTANSVTLNWDIPLGLVSGYRVYRNGLEVADVTDGLTNTYTDNGRTGGVTYTYAVRAYNAGGNSPSSALLPVLTKPGAPVGVLALPQSPTHVKIVWNMVPNTVTGYKVLRDGVVINTLDPSFVNQGILFYDDTSVVEGTEYTYQVIAYNASGDGQAVEAP